VVYYKDNEEWRDDHVVDRVRELTPTADHSEGCL